MESKRIGINELLEQKTGPIWIINTSNKVHKGGSEVYIVIPQGDQSSLFTVARTWLPIEATQRYSREALCKSQYFMEALAEELISVVSENEAQKMMAGPQAERERRRLKQLEEAVRAASSARGIGKNVMISTGDPERDAELEEESKKQARKESFIEKKTLDMNDDDDEPIDPIEPQFKAWVIRLNSLDNVDDVSSEIRMRGEMDIAEAVYLMKNCDHEQISERIRKKLMKIGELPKEAA